MFSWILGIFFLKNGRVFWAKLQLFVVLAKFYQIIIFQKFKKKLVLKGWNQHNMVRDVDIRAPGGRESLWTTGEKIDFSQAHCEVQNQPNLILSFSGHQSSPKLKPQPYLKFFGLRSWPPSAPKVPIFVIFKVDLRKYTWLVWAGTNGRCLFGLSSTMACKNCRQNVDTRKMVTIWNLPCGHMEHPNLCSHISRLSQHQIEWFLHKNKRGILNLQNE